MSCRPLLVGVDLVAVDVVARKGEADPRFLGTFLSEDELGSCPTRWDSRAGRFAAKEAAVKALGRGLRIDLREVEVRRERGGRPVLVFHGAARRRADELGVTSSDVSISHTEGLAVAVVGLVCAGEPLGERNADV